MKVLLTGATGFVGRNFSIEACRRGWQILAPVRDPVKLTRLASSDGLDPHKIQPLAASPSEWPKHLHFDAVVHCAGALFERSPEAYWRTNVLWSHAILACRPSGSPTVILSSQSAGGPTPCGRLSRSEADPDCPISWYGESKLRLERKILREYPREPIAILRPPMILGPRDAAALQLFRAVRAPFWPKPGWHKKWFSFLAVEDLVEAIFVALEKATALAGLPRYVAARQILSDLDLLQAASKLAGTRGVVLRLPHALVRGVAAPVDALPSLRRALPSLTRDRVKEIFPERWVVDSTSFEQATGWAAKATATQALASCYRHACSAQLL